MLFLHILSKLSEHTKFSIYPFAILISVKHIQQLSLLSIYNGYCVNKHIDFGSPFIFFNSLMLLLYVGKYKSYVCTISFSIFKFLKFIFLFFTLDL